MTVCLGDAEHPQPGQYLEIEGLTVAEGIETQAGSFSELSAKIGVDDGALTVEIGTPQGGSNTCINWLVVTPAGE